MYKRQALKIACDLVDEGHKPPAEAVAMIDPRNLDTLLHPQFAAAALKAATPLGKGLGDVYKRQQSVLAYHCQPETTLCLSLFP